MSVTNLIMKIEIGRSSPRSHLHIDYCVKCTLTSGLSAGTAAPSTLPTITSSRGSHSFHAQTGLCTSGSASGYSPCSSGSRQWECSSRNCDCCRTRSCRSRRKNDVTWRRRCPAKVLVVRLIAFVVTEGVVRPANPRRAFERQTRYLLCCNWMRVAFFHTRRHRELM